LTVMTLLRVVVGLHLIGSDADVDISIGILFLAVARKSAFGKKRPTTNETAKNNGLSLKTQLVSAILVRAVIPLVCAIVVTLVCTYANS
jgi:hypothetical protein